MTLTHVFTQLWRRNSWKAEAEQIAAQGVESLWPRIAQQIQSMTPAERYGYIRAHGTRAVARLIANQPRYAQWSASVQQEFQQLALERVIELALAKFARIARPQVVRRAA